MLAAARLIRDARTSNGLTQAELGRRLGITQAAVAQLERPGANPSVERLDEVLRAAGKRLALRAEPVSGDVDETLLARNLRMSPSERLDALETAHRELAELRELMPDGD
ncbi:MAG TPA: helix-turn-helix transcriptional regulator [Thermoleophilaceae bacterium]|nr:helix-turn-helix transcriptional regulator [Thermoleophilaceae bacterium]